MTRLMTEEPRAPYRPQTLVEMTLTLAERRRLRSVGLLGLFRRPRTYAPMVARPAEAAVVVPRREAQVRRLKARHEGLIRELKLAEQVQRSMLPRNLPQVAGVQFGAALRPAQHLAGDFYNAMRLDRDQVGFYVGDVMGHGPAAALLGVYAMQTLRPKRIEGSSYEILDPAVVLAELSRTLIAAEFPESPFVTMSYMVLDAANARLRYCCGGHPPALLLRRGQPPARLPGEGPLLGAFDMPFEGREVMLEPGDRLVLYSDGVETTGFGDRGVGVDGLATVLSARDGRPVQALVDDAMARARNFTEPADDLTLMMVQIDG